MKARPECIPCSLKQAMFNARQVSDNPRDAVKAMAAAMDYLKDVDLNLSPAEIASWCARRACEVLNVQDPFAEEKDRFNKIALDMVPYLHSILDKAQDPLHTAILLAAAGNIIDLGIFTDVDVRSTVDKVLTRGFAVDDYRSFKECVKPGAKLLYIGDNAGEIVFDRLLVEILTGMGMEVSFAVRSAPISNDVTVKDAGDVGMDRYARIIETGSWELGVPTHRCSKGFWDEYGSADLVISKGHANYETLEVGHPALFFLLTAKCEMVGQELGVKVGDTVLLYGGVADVL